MDPTTATVKEEPTASIVTFSVPPLLVPSTKPPLPRLLPKGPPPLVVRSLTNGKPLRRLAPAPVPLTVCGQILTTSAAAVPVAAQIVVPPPPASLPIVTAQINTTTTPIAITGQPDLPRCSFGIAYRVQCHRKYLAAEPGLIKWKDLDPNIQNSISINTKGNQSFTKSEDALICNHHLKELSYQDNKNFSEKGLCEGYVIVHKKPVLTTRLGILSYYNNIAGKNREVVPGKFVCSICTKILRGNGIPANLSSTFTSVSTTTTTTTCPKILITKNKTPFSIKIVPETNYSTSTQPPKLLQQSSSKMLPSKNSTTTYTAAAARNKTEYCDNIYAEDQFNNTNTDLPLQVKLDIDEEKEVVLHPLDIIVGEGSVGLVEDMDDNGDEELDPLDLKNEHEQYFQGNYSRPSFSSNIQGNHRYQNEEACKKRKLSELDSAANEEISTKKSMQGYKTGTNGSNSACVASEELNKKPRSKIARNTGSESEYIPGIIQPNQRRKYPVSRTRLIGIKTGTHYQRTTAAATAQKNSTSKNPTPSTVASKYHKLNEILVHAGVAPFLESNTDTPIPKDKLKLVAIQKLQQLLQNCIGILKEDDIELDFEAILEYNNENENG